MRKVLITILLLAPALFSQITPFPPSGGSGGSGAGGTYCAATGGASNALVCAGSPAPTSLTGLLLSMTVDASNSGATTLNVNSLGVKSILTSTGAAFSANQIAPGTTYIVSYDGTEFILQTISGAAGAPVSVTANKTLGAADAYIPQEMSGTGWTMNAPASLAGFAGACWPLRQVGSGTVTVSGNGNSILSNGSTVSSLTMVGAAAPSPGLTLCVDAAGTGLTATGAGPTGPTGPAGSPGSGSSYASNKTAVTVAANTTSDQTLQEVSLAAGILNTSGAPFLLHGSGIFTIGVAQTPAVTFKAKLCTISGCGSGTVVTLVSIATGATVAATNNTWNLNLKAINTATGATGTLLVHGPLAIDIGALTTVADTVYNDVNTASSATIDLTAALFVDFTVSTSAGSASNSFTQQIASVEPASSIGAAGPTGPQGPAGTLTPVSGGVLWPFGNPGINPTGSTLTPATGGINVTQFWEVFIPAPGIVVNNLSAFNGAGAQGHVAWALYDSTCTIIATSTTTSPTSNTASNWVFSNVTLSGGKNFIAATSDATTTQFYSPATDKVGDLAKLTESASTFHYFTGTAGGGTSTLTFPGTCGTRTAMGLSTLSNPPGIALH